MTLTHPLGFAGPAALAVLLLTAPGIARAAIVFADTSNLTTPWFNTTNNGGDVTFSARNAFTVTAAQGSSVLVVSFDEYAQNNTGADATPTINWVTGAGTQTLEEAVSQVSAAGSYVYCQVYYVYNPNVGAGNITLSASGREYSMNAYTLSGVNTAPSPLPCLTWRLQPTPPPSR